VKDPAAGGGLELYYGTRKGRALMGATFLAPAEGWYPSATLAKKKKEEKSVHHFFSVRHFFQCITFFQCVTFFSA
jgi:hypothetical protein